MTLSVGMRLGPYEILSAVGAGGMGEVYRARDTRLNRTIAVKVLPARLRENPELKQRFEREAEAIAALNHPHICVLHDIGQAIPSPQPSPLRGEGARSAGEGIEQAIDFLVMEYLEGETLAQRLTKGALPLGETLRYAIEIADALDKAHRQGIVHRDLKPGNIMLTKSGAKLLDFGLARIKASGVGGVALSELPTEQPLTAQGTILGTLQYMAPEQVEGKHADARTDIFAFGATVYEMATGKKAFEGGSQASLIAAILDRDPPPMSSLQPLTPPALDRLVRRCLRKDPNARWQTATDLFEELKWIAEGGTQVAVQAPAAVRRRTRERIGWAVALCAATIATAWLGVAYMRRAPSAPSAVRFSLDAPAGAAFSGEPSFAPAAAISPDGRHIAFMATRTGNPTPLLWVRSLDVSEARPLAGTEGGFFPFWSPDSRFIGFFAQGKLKKVDMSGGLPQTLCDAPAGEGGTWNREGIIVFAPSQTSGLYRVSAAGGQPTPLTTLDPARKERSHRWPHFLPDGRRFLYLAQVPNIIYAGSLDSPDTTRLMTTDSRAAYAPPGYLIFIRQNALLAQPFAARRVELAGEQFPIAENVRYNPTTGHAAFSVSESGLLAFRTGQGAAAQLTWFDRTGRQLETVFAPGDYRGVDLSPDGRQIVVHRHEEPGGGGLWLLDPARGTSSRLTFTNFHDTSPRWSPDGSRIVFSSNRDGGIYNLYQKIASGAGPDELLLKTEIDKAAEQWSADGRFIVYAFEKSQPDTDIGVLPLSGDRKPLLFLQTEFDEGNPQLSPDGRWMAYGSNESGRFEVYVRPFMGSGGKWQISTNSGRKPRWRRDGRELYYLADDRKLMAVEVNARGSTFEAGVPRALFQTRIADANFRAADVAGYPPQAYAVTADGQRFLILDAGEDVNTPVTVIVNWTAGIKR